MNIWKPQNILCFSLGLNGVKIGGDPCHSHTVSSTLHSRIWDSVMADHRWEPMIGLKNRKITHSLRSGPHLPLVLTKSSSFSPIGPRLGLIFRPRSRSAYPYSRPTGTVRVKTFTHKALSNLGEAHSTQAGCRQLRVTYIRKGDESPEVGNY